MPSPDFRSQLERILRSKNPEAVRQFLVEQGQWPEDTTNTERAMWLMIAGNPALRDLHAEAHNWLISHGAQAEAEMLLERESTPQKPATHPSAKTRGGAGYQVGRKLRQNTGAAKRSRSNTD